MISSQLNEAIEESAQAAEQAVRVALKKYRGGATPREIADEAGLSLAVVERALQVMKRKRQVAQDATAASAPVMARGTGAAVVSRVYRLV